MLKPEGIAYLQSLAPWNGRGGFGLDCVRRVADAWGNPQDVVPSVHVAGTNGKGSVSAYIATILGRSGKRVGLTTSPHLVRMNERIVLEGRPIDDGELSKYALELREVVQSCGGELSFFEAVTLIFFHACRHRKLDWMVVEVGLGGRLDATNIIARPEVCCVTTIDFDHQDILGESLEQIATEKAGIIKSGALVLCGERKRGPAQVIALSAERAACEFRGIDVDFGWESQSTEKIEFWDKRSEVRICARPSLQGHYQRDNAAIAVCVARHLQIVPAAIIDGVESTRWPGRLERLQLGDRECILDAGHNAAGVRTLTAFLESSGKFRVEIGFGVLKTKNWREMVDLLIPYVTFWNLLRPDSGAAVEPEEVAAYLSSRGISSQVYGADYSRFLSKMRAGDRYLPLVLVGSIYLMGLLRGRIVQQDNPLW